MNIPRDTVKITTEPITINNQIAGYRLHAYAYDESVGYIFLGCKEVSSKEEVTHHLRSLNVLAGALAVASGLRPINKTIDLKGG